MLPTPAKPKAVNKFPIGTPYVVFSGHDNETDGFVIFGWLGWDGTQYIWEKYHPNPNPYPSLDSITRYLDHNRCRDPNTQRPLAADAHPVELLECLGHNYGHGSRFRISELRIKS